jgi:hypothetical protein
MPERGSACVGLRAVVDLDRQVHQGGQVGDSCAVGVGGLRLVGDHGGVGGEVRITDAPQVQIGHAGIAIGISRSSRILPVRASSPRDHHAIIAAPTRPIIGSSQARPANLPASSATIASTEVAASASTCR